MVQLKSLEEIDVWEHPPQCGNHTERGEEQEVFRGESDGLSSPTPLQDDSTQDDADATIFSGLLLEISFTVITWNQVSNCTCRKKNHFLFRWSTLTLPEQHTRHLMYCWRKYWWLLERGWRKRIFRCMDKLHKIYFIERKATWRIYNVRGETDEEKNFKIWQYVEAYVWCSEKESKTKMGCRETKARQCQTIERNILHCTRRRRIQSSQWKPLVQSWKFRCQQQCLAKYR